jgi:hypothetical protein
MAEKSLQGDDDASISIIKAEDCGRAIGMLLRRGGSFQTRHENILIVNSEQRKVLEEADLVESNSVPKRTDGKHARKKKRSLINCAPGSNLLAVPSA